MQFLSWALLRLFIILVPLHYIWFFFSWFKLAYLILLCLRLKLSVQYILVLHFLLCQRLDLRGHRVRSLNAGGLNLSTNLEVK